MGKLHLEFRRLPSPRPVVNEFVPMPPHSVSRLLNRNGAVSLVGLPPVFLAPALLTLANSVQRSAFSSSSAYLHRNRKRGVSAIHRTGPKQQLSASKYPLPQPVAPEDREARQANPNHGLWAFFPQNRHAIPTPEEEYAFGVYMPVYHFYIAVLPLINHP